MVFGLKITFASSRKNCSMLSNATGCPHCSKNLCQGVFKTLNPNLESGLSSDCCRHTRLKPEALMIAVILKRSLRSLESLNTILGIITQYTNTNTNTREDGKPFCVHTTASLNPNCELPIECTNIWIMQFGANKVDLPVNNDD